MKEVPTSMIKMTECHTQKEQKDIKLKENVSYEVPPSRIKMTEYNTQKEQKDIELKENVSYEVPPSRIKMTECEAYGTLPNKP